MLPTHLLAQRIAHRKSMDIEECVTQALMFHDERTAVSEPILSTNTNRRSLDVAITSVGCLRTISQLARTIDIPRALYVAVPILSSRLRL